MLEVIDTVYLVVLTQADGTEVNTGAFLTQIEARQAVKLLERAKMTVHVEAVEIGVPQDVGLTIRGDKLVHAVTGRDADQMVADTTTQISAPRNPDMTDATREKAIKAAQRAKDRHEERMAESRRAVNAARRAKAKASAQVSA